jgi:hypothetical protein
LAPANVNKRNRPRPKSKALFVGFEMIDGLKTDGHQLIGGLLTAVFDPPFQEARFGA